MNHVSTNNETNKMETCNAILKQGANKGKQCWRPIKKDGFCGKHQSDAILKQGESDGLYKCSTHRCMTMISKEKYCDSCISKKEEERKTITLCKGKITQGKNKGTPCNKLASTPEGYCGKHTLQSLIEKTTLEGNRICDDGKRACKNYTKDGKLKCEDCLKKAREKDTAEYSKKKEEGRCLDCGCELFLPIEGFRREIQRCELCYEKLKEVEKARGKRDRNYKEERKTNIELHFNNYKKNAIRRNLCFTIDFDTFSRIVQSPCFYCNVFKDTEVIGIDRIDNSHGYENDNIVSCCQTCNFMKGELSFDDFKKHIEQILVTLKTRVGTIVPSIEPKKSYIRPKEIINLYNAKKLDDYIEMCIEDGRSPSFIEKIRELKSLEMPETDVRAFIKNALWLETKSNGIVERSRVSSKELFGYLELGNIEKCIEKYTEVYEEPVGFRTDIERLVRLWNTKDNDSNIVEFNRILVKYRNKRNK